MLPRNLAIIAVVSAIGLGFLLTDAVLIPLPTAFLLATVVGLYLGVRYHHRRSAFVVGGALVTLVGIAFAGSGSLAAVGIALLIGASLLNVWLRAQQLSGR